MSDSILSNTIRGARRERGWSQAELAAKAGVSRAEISAVETERQVPSTTTSLRLAQIFGCSVEELFTLDGSSVSEPSWAWPPRDSTAGVTRFWEARVGPRHLLIPVEPTALGTVPHDGCFGPRGFRRERKDDAERTLVVAGCDPAVGFLAAELFAREGIRLLPLTRGTSDALALLRQGHVHAAGIHWSGESEDDANAAMAARTLGDGFRLLHVTQWQEGVALEHSVRTRAPRSLAKARLRWIAREEGSGARRVLDRLLRGQKQRFRHEARDHRGVAVAIRSGYAQAGVTVRLAAEEAGLDFVTLAHEDYDLCFSDELRGTPPLAALRRVMKRAALKRLTRELPGQNVTRMGEERIVEPPHPEVRRTRGSTKRANG